RWDRWPTFAGASSVGTGKMQPAMSTWRRTADPSMTGTGPRTPGAARRYSAYPCRSRRRLAGAASVAIVPPPAPEREGARHDHDEQQQAQLERGGVARLLVDERGAVPVHDEGVGGVHRSALGHEGDGVEEPHEVHRAQQH